MCSVMLETLPLAPPSTAVAPAFQAGLAVTAAEVIEAQRLRYEVFVSEMGADGPSADHRARCERDRFDDFADHLVLKDLSRPRGAQIVGTYRLLTGAGARTAGGFYSESEFDLAPLLTSGLSLLELGRGCLLPSYRGGDALVHLWRALAQYVEANRIDLLFGTASFPTIQIADLSETLSHLLQSYPAPENLRVTSRCSSPFRMLPADGINRVQAMRNTPALIKAYLRMGGTIGQGVFVDHAFNTTDICMILRSSDLTGRAAALYRDTKAQG